MHLRSQMISSLVHLVIIVTLHAFHAVDRAERATWLGSDGRLRRVARARILRRHRVGDAAAADAARVRAVPAGQG